MDPGTGAGGELLGNVAAFKTGDHMETGLPDGSGDLLDGDIGVPTQVRHIPVVVFV